MFVWMRREAGVSQADWECGALNSFDLVFVLVVFSPLSRLKKIKKISDLISCSGWIFFYVEVRLD